MPHRTQMPSGRYAYLDGPPKLKRDPNSFDSASARVLVHGSRSTVQSLFPPGSATSGISENLFCLGAEIEKELCGHVWASVTWKGFYETHDMIVAHSVSARQTQWPQQSGNITVYVPGHMIKKPTNTNPNTGQYYRVRLTDQLAGVSVRGFARAPRLSPPAPPLVSGSATTPMIGGKVVRPINRPQSFAGLEDPIYNFPQGWVLMNYDFEETIILSAGDDGEALYLWTANYEWNPDYGP